MQLRKILNLKFNLNNTSKIQAFQPLVGSLTYKPCYNHSKISNLFKDKSFADVISIMKNQQSPYPKNSAYYNSILYVISNQCSKDQKLIYQQQAVIGYFFSEILDRIKIIGINEAITTLKLLVGRSKYFKIQKNILLALHTKFQIRFRQMIKLNEQKNANQEEIINLQHINQMLIGILGLRSNTTILNKVLTYANKLYMQQKKEESRKQNAKKQFYFIFQTLCNHAQDAIDSMRLAIYQFAREQYTNGTLQYEPQILSLMVLYKFYKNYPVVSNPQWFNNYVKNYLQMVLSQQHSNLLQSVYVFQKSVEYLLHVEIHIRQKYFAFLDKLKNKIFNSIIQLAAKSKLDNQFFKCTENTLLIASFVKTIPTYTYLTNYYRAKNLQGQGILNRNLIQSIIKEIRPLCTNIHFLIPKRLKELINQNQQSSQKLTTSKPTLITNNILQIMLSLTNTLKDLNIVRDYDKKALDYNFCYQLLQVYLQCCHVFMKMELSEILYMRILEHSTLLILQLQQFALSKQKIIMHKNLLIQMILKFDNFDANYKIFSIIRLISIAKCLGVKLKNLSQKNKQIKMKKTNIYIETLSRTMLKKYNTQEIINVCQFVNHDSLILKDLELGRLILFSAKQQNIVRFWLYLHKAKFTTKFALNQRILEALSSIVRKDNLQINKNNMLIFQQLCIINKIKQLGDLSMKIGQDFDDSRSQNQKRANSSKGEISSNFAMIIRYGIFDHLIDQIYTVNKTTPMSFTDRFSHIEYVKTLCLASYISQDQAIFYFNPQNKSSFFRFITLLCKKSSLPLKQNAHYIFGRSYSDQSIIIKTIRNVLQKFLPQNKSINKAISFYCQFLRYFIRINKINQFFQNKISVYLLVKDIIEQYKLLENGQSFSGIFNHIESNIERLSILSIFQKIATTKSAIKDAMTSFNSIIDQKIFSKFKTSIIGLIKKDISLANQKNQKENFQTNNNLYLVRKLLFYRFQSLKNLQEFSDSQILLSLTQNVFVHYKSQAVDHNIGLILARIIKLSPIEFLSYSLFKKIAQNLLIILPRREEDINLGNLSSDNAIRFNTMKKWLATQLIRYSKRISNISQLKDIICILNELNLDILSLQPKVGQNFDLSQLFAVELDVQSISLFFQQSILFYKNSNPQKLNQNFLIYLKKSFKAYHQSAIVNNYSVYFRRQGQYILNMFKSLFLVIADTCQHNNQAYENVNDQIIKFKQISRSVLSENKKDTSKNNKKKNRNTFYNEIQQKEYAVGSHFSSFVTTILQKLIMQKRNQNRSFQQLFSKENLSIIKLINQRISQNQKKLAIQCQLNYFTGNQTIKMAQLQNQLKLYSKNKQNNQKKTLYYFVDRQNTMWNLQNDEFRINGYEQMMILYLEKILKVINQENLGNFQLKIIRNGHSKSEYQFLL